MSSEPETYNVYRVTYRTPASYLASDEDRERGYVEKRTLDGFSKNQVRRDNYELSRRDETHAEEVLWETRQITCGPWEVLPDD